MQFIYCTAVKAGSGEVAKMH